MVRNPVGGYENFGFSVSFGAFSIFLERFSHRSSPFRNKKIRSARGSTGDVWKALLSLSPPPSLATHTGRLGTTTAEDLAGNVHADDGRRPHWSTMPWHGDAGQDANRPAAFGHAHRDGEKLQP